MSYTKPKSARIGKTTVRQTVPIEPEVSPSEPKVGMCFHSVFTVGCKRCAQKYPDLAEAVAPEPEVEDTTCEICGNDKNTIAHFSDPPRMDYHAFKPRKRIKSA